jgi:hypothetical protein
MKFKLLVAIGAVVTMLGFGGCADQQETQEPVKEIGNKFQEGISGRGKLIEPERTDPSRF